MRSRLMWRMLAPVLVVSVLLLLVGVTSAWYAHRLNSRVSDELDRNLAGAIAAQNLVLAIRDTRAELDRYLSTGDAAFLVAASAREEQVGRLLENLSQTAPDAEFEAVAQLGRRHERFVGQFTAAERQADAAPSLSALRAALTDQMLTPAQQLLERNRDAAERQSRRNQVMAERIGIGLMVLGLCGATAGLLAGYGIARSVSRSIEQLGGHVQEIAGRLNGHSDPGDITRTDLPELHTAIRDIAAKTTAVVQQLHDSRAQAERSEQLAAVGQLAAGLAHELRNPLTSMKLLVQSAADQEEGLTGRGLEILDEEIARLDGLLQSLLDFARPPGLQKSPTDLRQLISHVVELTAPRAAQKGLQVVPDVSSSATTVHADAQQLRQVLLNLLLNAIDFSPDGGRVTIGLTSVNDQCNEAILTVSDQGPGLPDELDGRIFEPFVSTKETGIGLGLAVCSRIVEQHGGQIGAASGPHGGATFTVQLPVAPSSDVDRLA